MVAAQHLRFLRAFISRPQQVGALAPSSRYLARAMIKGFDLAHAKVVIEVGPGTGAFTESILNAKGADTRLIAIERNPQMATHLRARFPNLELFVESAEHTPEILERLGLERAEYIICGLPWASFSDELQNVLLKSILRSLKETGVFSTFTYTTTSWLPSARRFRAKLEAHFANVELTPTVWRNMPPAFAYRCFR
ncbi:MAG: class I SAM-dependent methyltransferase [Planctomycetota bacterium]